MTKNIGAIVLAAGFSSRFGSSKLCAKLNNGYTVLQQTLARIHAANLPCIVITRPEMVEQLQVQDTALAIFEGAADGMGASLAFGIDKAQHWDACLVCLADMPFIRSSTYRQIADRLSRSTMVLPYYQSRPGNPVGFGADFYPQLQALHGDSGARTLTRTNPDAAIELHVDDPAVLNDIDTPNDLSRFQTRP